MKSSTRISVLLAVVSLSMYVSDAPAAPVSRSTGNKTFGGGPSLLHPVTSLPGPSNPLAPKNTGGNTTSAQAQLSAAPSTTTTSGKPGVGISGRNNVSNPLAPLVPIKPINTTSSTTSN